MKATCQFIGKHNSHPFTHFHFRGMRQKRYESVEKMLDLLDVAKRIGPKFPLQAMMLDPHDPEWDDAMTYLYVDYPMFKRHLVWLSGASFLFLYNFNIFFHNKNF